LFGIGFVPPPPRGPRRRKPKPGEKHRRQEMSASLAGAKDMGAVLLAVVMLAAIVVLAVTLSSLQG
jgi:hypothetical protein